MFHFEFQWLLTALFMLRSPSSTMPTCSQSLYSKHVTAEIRPEKLLVDDSSLKEFSRQRDYLERTVAGLKHKLTKDTHLQRADNIRVVQVSRGWTLPNVPRITWRAIICTDPSKELKRFHSSERCS